jgi:hypothetical protein
MLRDSAFGPEIEFPGLIFGRILASGPDFVIAPRIVLILAGFWSDLGFRAGFWLDFGRAGFWPDRKGESDGRLAGEVGLSLAPPPGAAGDPCPLGSVFPEAIAVSCRSLLVCCYCWPAFCRKSGFRAGFLAGFVLVSFWPEIGLPGRIFARLFCNRSAHPAGPEG